MSEDRLKPCPLCGDPEPVNRSHGIECRTCGIWFGDGSLAFRRGGVIKSWNTRPLEAENKRLREALEQIAYTSRWDGVGMNDIARNALAHEEGR